VSARRRAHIPPLTAGRSLIGVSGPLLAGWIVATALRRTDLFTGPFFWVFTYLLVVGVAVFALEAVTASNGRCTRVRVGSAWSVVLEELAFGVASFLLFSAFVGR
jgi:hypothetical protein